MRGIPDISTVELSRTRLKLRDDLLFVPQIYDGTSFYHIEVKTTAEYFRIGYPEYVFVSLLDGRTTFSEALAVASQKLKTDALNQTQAMAIYSWLLDNGLAAFADADTSASGALSSVRSAATPDAFWKKLNPLWMKLPLGRPEALLQAINPVLGWIFFAPATIASILLMSVAGLMLGSHWDQFSASSANVIARENWLWLLGAWIGLKFFHELGHGLVCQRYGGNIRETGIVLAFLAPLAYVDASSSWSFRSRWQRIHTAMAGVYVELVIASIAAIVWSQSESPLVRHLLQNVIVMASLSTVLFNLNPLMKFDGYYVFSDLLQVPNLSSQASSILQSLGNRIFFGEFGAAPTVIGRKWWILLAYGVAAAVWRMLVCLSLLITASVLFRGAGIALAAVGVVMWFGAPLWKVLTSAWRLWLQHPERLLRASLVSGIAIAVILAGLLGLPAPVMTTAPGIVDFTDGEVVRAVSPGFVESVHVENGKPVVEGDLLISLRNDEVTARLLDLQKQVEQEELRLQTASHDHDSGAISVAQANLKSLSTQLAECQKQVNGLQLRSGRAGRVAGRDLRSLNGTFAKAGMELLTIGLDNEKEVQLSVGQRELGISTSLIGRQLQVRIGTHPAFTGTLVRVNPRASRKIPHAALAATNGGPLPVSEVEKSEKTESDERLRLTEHRFTAIVQLPSDAADRLRCGERGTATLGLPRGSLGTHLWRSAHDWVDAQLSQLSQ